MTFTSGQEQVNYTYDSLKRLSTAGKTADAHDRWSSGGPAEEPCRTSTQSGTRLHDGNVLQIRHEFGERLRILGVGATGILTLSFCDESEFVRACPSSRSCNLREVLLFLYGRQQRSKPNRGMVRNNFLLSGRTLAGGGCRCRLEGNTALMLLALIRPSLPIFRLVDLAGCGKSRRRRESASSQQPLHAI